MQTPVPVARTPTAQARDGETNSLRDAISAAKQSPKGRAWRDLTGKEKLEKADCIVTELGRWLEIKLRLPQAELLRTPVHVGSNDHAEVMVMLAGERAVQIQPLPVNEKLIRQEVDKSWETQVGDFIFWLRETLIDPVDSDEFWALKKKINGECYLIETMIVAAAALTKLGMAQASVNVARLRL